MRITRRLQSTETRSKRTRAYVSRRTVGRPPGIALPRCALIHVMAGILRRYKSFG